MPLIRYLIISDQNNFSRFDFQKSIGFVINKTAKALVYTFDQELRKNFGVTFGQWKVLVILANYEKGVTQKEIADNLGLEGSTLIPIIDRLEKDAWILRKPDQQDRRNNRILLTEKACSSLKSMISSAEKIKSIAIKDISEENISITTKTLEKMWLNIINEYNLTCEPENKQQMNKVSTTEGDLDILWHKKDMQGKSYII
ncbi:MAG: MarR family transcriptional regulator [Thermoproteota archaeon]|nr:MarR family transcriptional regulator [Thermoproteota archaeon]